MSGQRGPITGAVGAGRPRRGERALAPAQRGNSDLVLPSIKPGEPLPLPDPPEDLGEAGALLWGDIWASSGHLGTGDEPLIAEIARLVDLLALAYANVRANGLTVLKPIVTPRGDVVGEEPVLNPAAAFAEKAVRTLGVLFTSAGLTPQSRARLGIRVQQLRNGALRNGPHSAS